MAHLQQFVIYPLGDAHLAAYNPLIGFVRAPLPGTLTPHSPTHTRVNNRAPQAANGRSRLLAPPSLARSLAKGACLNRSVARPLSLSSWHWIDDDRFGSRGAGFESPF